MEQLLPDIETTPDPASFLRYRIDPEWYQQHQRSFYYTLRERLCEESHDRALVQAAIAAAPAGRRRAATPEEGLIKEIQDCCSVTPEFRSGRPSLGEILFRLLLAGGNQPATAQELYDQVRSWVGPSDGRAINPEVVQRLLETDQHYGFAPAAP